MGNLLNAPKTEKDSHHFPDLAGYEIGASGMQGWRLEQEDAHIVASMPSKPDHIIVAVFDGHGGEQVAFFCEKHLPRILLDNEEYKAKNYEKALQETFVEIDWLLINDEGQKLMEAILLQMK